MAFITQAKAGKRRYLLHMNRVELQCLRRLLEDCCGQWPEGYRAPAVSAEMPRLFKATEDFFYDQEQMRSAKRKGTR